MPYFDGTGPRGKGRLTGRGLGKCVIPGTKATPKNWLSKVTSSAHRQLGKQKRIW